MASDKSNIPGIDVNQVETTGEVADISAARLLMDAKKEIVKKQKQNPLVSKVNDVIASGENTFSQFGRIEVKAFDSSFLDALETGLEAVGRILANPRTFIKETTELENVEKAKKVSSLSIRHFATHSQYLRSVEDNGEVIPDKILTIHSETNTAIYENRFVMTLIKRSLSFIEQRYNFVREHGETRDSDELFIHSKSRFGEVNYEIAMRVKASIPSSDAGESEKNASLLKRLETCKSRVNDYLHSNFMTQMKGAKDVTSPVHMTNMLLKHPDYHAAYELWEFIEGYESLGVSYDVEEIPTEFDEEYLEELYALLGEAVMKLRSRHFDKARVNPAKRLTPKVIFSLDEVNYEDSRFFYDAYPEAKKEVDPTKIILEEERKQELETYVNHLSSEELAKTRLNKAINKDKDTVAFESAKKRDEQKSVLEEKVALKREEENKKQLELEALEEQKRIEELEEESKQEQERYHQSKAMLEGGKA